MKKDKQLKQFLSDKTRSLEIRREFGGEAPLLGWLIKYLIWPGIGIESSKSCGIIDPRMRNITFLGEKKKVIFFAVIFLYLNFPSQQSTAIPKDHLFVTVSTLSINRKYGFSTLSWAFTILPSMGTVSTHHKPWVLCLWVSKMANLVDTVRKLFIDESTSH